MPGLDRIIQQDFSAGMFQSAARERIPANGAYDIVNGLLDETGSIYKRGGTTYITALSTSTERITGLWQGTLTVGTVIVLITATNIWLCDLNGMSIAGPFPYTAMTVPRRVAAYDGVLYLPGGFTFDGTTLAAGAATWTGAPYVAVVANRLIAANFSKVVFSGIGTPGTFAGTDFHKLPDGVSITGLVGLRDSAFVFTTQGVWVISNLGLNLTDAAGNVQQRLDQYSTDMILWGDAGIAGWAGGLVVPARDGVWLMSRGVASEAPVPFQMISSPISALYRSYVAAGYRPGQAIVYKGHYILPILSAGAGAWVDTLVCRLDAQDSRGRPSFPWTHFTGEGAQLAAMTIRTVTGGLLGAAGLIGALNIAANDPLVVLSYFDPPAASLDGVRGVGPANDITFQFVTRDFATGPGNENTVADLRLDYELTDPGSVNPTITAEVDSAGSWTALTGSALEAPADPFRWQVAKRRRYARLRFTNTNAATRLAIKQLDVRVRSSGRA